MAVEQPQSIATSQVSWSQDDTRQRVLNRKRLLSETLSTILGITKKDTSIIIIRNALIVLHSTWYMVQSIPSTPL